MPLSQSPIKLNCQGKEFHEVISNSNDDGQAEHSCLPTDNWNSVIMSQLKTIDKFPAQRLNASSVTILKLIKTMQQRDQISNNTEYSVN